jgi:hypothetical protein
MEAARNDQGDYSSLTKRSFGTKQLINAQKKVLRDEIDYSAESLKAINSKEQIEKKRARIVDTVLFYVGHLKGGSGRPDEAQEILDNFAELIRQELVQERGINWADLSPEQQSLLEIKGESNNAAKKLTENKGRISSLVSAAPEGENPINTPVEEEEIIQEQLAAEEEEEKKIREEQEQREKEQKAEVELLAREKRAAFFTSQSAYDKLLRQINAGKNSNTDYSESIASLD